MPKKKNRLGETPEDFSNWYNPDKNTSSVTDIDPMVFDKIRMLGERWDREHSGMQGKSRMII